MAGCRYVLVESTGDDSWYGTKILPGTVEESEANQHYSQCCQVIHCLQAHYVNSSRCCGEFYFLSELSLEWSECSLRLLSCHENYTSLQGPSLDPWDWTSNVGMESFQTVADAQLEQDEEMLRLDMESALKQFSTIGISDSYNQIMPHAPPGSDCVVTFRDWLPRDNPTCNVLS